MRTEAPSFELVAYWPEAVTGGGDGKPKTKIWKKFEFGRNLEKFERKNKIL